MREYCKLHPPLGSKHRKDNEVAAKILLREVTTTVDFTPVQSVLDARAADDVARFPPNPEENWGPKRRHGRLMKEGKGADVDEELPKKSKV